MAYVRFDEIENVLSSLDLLAILAPLVKKRQAFWKWIIVAAHDSVQGALVCAIADSTGTSVLDKKSARKVLEWFDDTSKEYPGEWMADFNTLLKRAAIKMTASDARDIKKLHGFRNDFAHFTPKSWSIEVAGLPRIIGVAVQLAESLMKEQRVEHRMTETKSAGFGTISKQSKWH